MPYMKEGFVVKSVMVPWIYKDSLKLLPDSWQRTASCSMETAYYGTWLDVEIGEFAEELSALGLPKSEISGSFAFIEEDEDRAWACRFDVEAGEAKNYRETSGDWRPLSIPYPFVVEDHEEVR